MHSDEYVLSLLISCLIGFLPFLGFVGMLIVWLRARSEDESPRDLRDGLLFFLCALSLSLILGVSAFLIVPTPFIVAAAYVATMVLCERYQTRQMVFVRALAAATEKQIPLVPLIRAMARESDIFYRRRLRRLARHLESGATLLDAVQSVRGVVPDSAVVAILAGTLSGRLGPALREAADEQSLQRPLWREVSMGAIYVFGLLMIGAGIVQFMVLLIVPKFEQIVDDFGMPQPAPMMMLVELANSVWVQVLGILLVSAMFFFLVLAVLFSLGLIRWSFAPLDRLRRRIDTALILRSLAAMAEAGKPFAPLLDALASGYPSAWARRRLEFTARQVAIGSDWCVALESHGLISSADAAVIQAGARVGNLPWVLRELAASSERRFVYRLSALGQVLLPLAIVACGLLVLIIVVVCFQPLVNLIGNLT